MNSKCPECDTKHERENGYFMGAMVLAYVMGAGTVIPTIVLMVRYFEAEIPMVIGAAIFQLIILQPIIYMYSRMVWMYLDRGVNRKGWQ
jgi:hypothetical protein